MSNVGQWFRRVYFRSGYETTKWHHIQSEIEDRLVTRCGRQMKRDTGNAGDQELEFVDDRPLPEVEVCRFC